MMSPRHLILGALALLSLPAAAQELSWSAYGTIGYAASNRGFSYQRSINDDGTFDRDSVFGAQLDLRLNPRWSATLQLKAAQSLDHDSRWDLTPAWAFLAWRPSDDWLLRAGKLRVPLYLHSESLDVGVTHDMARLPAEMYSMSPSNDFYGLYATKTWPHGEGELSLDGYSGRIKTTARFWTRDGLPPVVNPGPRFLEVDVKVTGAVLTLRQPESTWRAAYLNAVARQGDGSLMARTYAFVDLGGGLGYYKVNDALPGPPLETTSSLTNHVVTLGVEQRFAQHWRVAAEFARNIQKKSEVGADTYGGYLALFRSIGPATPYVSYGLLRSNGVSRDWYRRLTETQLPAFIPGADQINASQRLAAEAIWALDQRALALGSSYSIDHHQKLKLEWMRTRIGQVSRLVDTPPGSATPRDVNIDTWSLSYSFSF